MGMIGFVLGIILVWYLVVDLDSNAQSVMNECLENLYTISDYNEIDYILEKQDEIKNNGTLEMYNDFMNFGFQEYCTDNCLSLIMKNRIYLRYRHAPKAKKFTVSVKSIKFKEESKIIEQNLEGYLYHVDLKINYMEAGNSEIVSEEGFISVKTDAGSWKVDAIEPVGILDVFKY